MKTIKPNESCGVCSDNYIIDTVDGFKEVSTLKVGDKILTEKGYNPITYISDKEEKRGSKTKVIGFLKSET